MLLALAFGFAASTVPHVELPSTFSGDRVFVMPRVENSMRRLALWVDTDGGGFLRSGVVDALHLQRGAMKTAYLPRLDEVSFPPVTGNHGALPILSDAGVANDPVFSGVDGQLGWTWLSDRIWTIDYVGRHVYWDRTAPNFRDAYRVALSFDRAHRYPSLEMEIDGKTYHAALDTAATVALSQRALTSLNDGMPQVRATSFIPRRTLASWHAAHPEWTYIADAGYSRGVAMIRVPEVRAGRVTFHDVWFSTRPDDDVFHDDSVDAKLGPTAFGKCAVTIDYVHDDAAFECRSAQQ
jgi:hypothetical protein